MSFDELRPYLFMTRAGPLGDGMRLFERHLGTVSFSISGGSPPPFFFLSQSFDALRFFEVLLTLSY